MDEDEDLPTESFQDEAESFQDEASCSICLGFFQDPVSIHCGHNFCRACITRRWEEEEGAFPCPRCQATAKERKLRPNRELAKILEIAKRLSLRAAPGGGRLCPRHREPLKLFCEEERRPICLVCRESQEHRLHPAVPVEEAAEELKEKLQVHVQTLKEKKEKLQGLREAEEGKSMEFHEKVEKERQKVVAGLEELRKFLEEQEGTLLGRLEKLDGEIRRRKEESVAKLLGEISTITERIRELEEKCQQPPCDFLQDSGDILSRLEEEKEQKAPEIFPEMGATPPSTPQKNVALKEMLLKLRANLTLDPDTAHPHLVLSEDLKSVRWEGTRRVVPDNPQRFDASRCVLGSLGFQTGRHYWEVEVGDGQAWAVGLAKESVKRKGRVSIKPEAGIWAVGQCGSQWQALTSPPSPIALPAAPKVLGVYLGYEEGRVVFFDGDNMAPVFAHAPAAFGGERVLPLLCLGRGCHFTLCP